MNHFVYILQSRVNNSFYKGSTNSLSSRLKQHNDGLDTYTKKFAPWDMVWFTVKESKADAIKLERKLKNLSSKRLVEFMNKYPISILIDGITISSVRDQ